MKKIKQFIIAILMFPLLAPAMVLASDTSPLIPLPVDGVVKIDNVTRLASPPSSAGESSAGNSGQGENITTYCSSVTYSNWGSCVICPWFLRNGCQQRAVTDSTPVGCALTAAQQADSSRVCALPQVLGVKIENSEISGNAVNSTDARLSRILADAAAIWSENINTILAGVGAVRDENSEKTTADKYLSDLTHNEKSFLPADANRLNFFITYGTVGTKVLGAGERAGVINSYLASFGKLPKTETEWQDAIKIANGRWPSERNIKTESAAIAAFKKIYKRSPNMKLSNDNAAVMVIAYGLRPTNRNLNSEKAAIKSFKAIYGYAPKSTTAWDIVRAIAYSGAKR